MTRRPSTNLEAERTAQRLLDIADNIAVSPTFQRRGAPIPDISIFEYSQTIEEIDGIEILSEEIENLLLEYRVSQRV
jgi:hypothetical protein